MTLARSQREGSYFVNIKSHPGPSESTFKSSEESRCLKWFFLWVLSLILMKQRVPHSQEEHLVFTSIFRRQTKTFVLSTSFTRIYTNHHPRILDSATLDISSLKVSILLDQRLRPSIFMHSNIATTCHWINQHV